MQKIISTLLHMLNDSFPSTKPMCVFAVISVGIHLFQTDFLTFKMIFSLALYRLRVYYF